MPSTSCPEVYFFNSLNLSDDVHRLHGCELPGPTLVCSFADEACASREPRGVARSGGSRRRIIASPPPIRRRERKLPESG
ncbi:hypothetical protein VTN96DRAFT_2420 [Rasamsonia emersonii]